MLNKIQQRLQKETNSDTSTSLSAGTSTSLSAGTSTSFSACTLTPLNARSKIQWREDVLFLKPT